MRLHCLDIFSFFRARTYRIRKAMDPPRTRPGTNPAANPPAVTAGHSLLEIKPASLCASDREVVFPPDGAKTVSVGNAGSAPSVFCGQLSYWSWQKLPSQRYPGGQHLPLVHFVSWLVGEPVVPQSEGVRTRQSWPVGQQPTAVLFNTAMHSVFVGQQKLEIFGSEHLELPVPQASAVCLANIVSSGYCFGAGDANIKRENWRRIERNASVLVDFRAMLYFLRCPV
ncbi:hypothetical protein ABW21_db0206377 [Orbilia brochopaga]|nr:hypothetical protein ABW21_db0206377 [Drechslerella brochopaga]